ncbi:Na+/H+ antiporter subunit E [Deinococcus aetherius]|uniref:Na+/H+ antiporter subunit E n=1 Tax=Deinococcus aetherius TaxID=200252 RepID=A0ABM8A9L6_9DEIO|nr:Na+/H+ antiporter subunit E [Deinococcus aetherius]BDP40458.1 Na+/H+ antiporter subunit E [Deinococcus aetherius]
MRGFALNLLLAVVWALFAGEVSLRELAVGFGLGFAVLAVFPRALATHEYVRQVLAGLGFVGFFLRELTVANVQIALFALRPHPPLNPMIVAVPLRLEGEGALTFLAATIGLMPGTVALGFSPDRRTLYAHAIGTPDARAAREAILRVEDRLLRVSSPLPPAPPEVRP